MLQFMNLWLDNVIKPTSDFFIFSEAATENFASSSVWASQSYFKIWDWLSKFWGKWRGTEESTGFFKEYDFELEFDLYKSILRIKLDLVSLFKVIITLALGKGVNKWGN